MLFLIIKAWASYRVNASVSILNTVMMTLMLCYQKKEFEVPIITKHTIEIAGVPRRVPTHVHFITMQQ